MIKDSTRPIETPENWKALLPNEHANIFPLVLTDELQKTFPTMWEEGKGYDPKWPVILYKNEILDGRNRLRAAIQANQVPVFHEFTGNDEEALDFVVRANLNRRQLTDQQRALVAARLVPMFVEMGKKRMSEAGREGGIKSGASRRGETQGVAVSPHPGGEPKKPAPKSRDKAAALMNVSPSTTGRAMRLLADAPDLVAKVEEGKMGVWEADNMLKQRKAEEQNPDECDESVRIKNAVKDLNRRVTEARLNPPQARAISDEELEDARRNSRRSEGNGLAERYCLNVSHLFDVFASAMERLPNEGRRTLIDKLKELY